MNNKRIQIEGPERSTRRAAVSVRLQIEALNSSGNRVVVDFEAVEDVTESYADELFGVLVLKYGLAKLSDHAVIVNASDKVLLAIARAIKHRCDQRGEDPQQLLAR